MNLTLLEVPTNLGLMPTTDGILPGTAKAPSELKRLLSHAGLNFDESEEILIPEYEDDGAFTEIGIRNLAGLRNQSIAIADAVEKKVRNGFFPVVLGGDCSVLLGSMLGLHRIGEAGLLFIDGHTDFFLPEQSSTGGAAGMDLALVTGWGPAALTNIEGGRPYVSSNRVVALGNRDFEARPTANIPNINDAINCYLPLQRLRDIGIKTAARQAVSALGDSGLGYWIHLDVDVIDSIQMPAVDSPQPDGLSWEEFADLVTASLTSHAIGIQITIYDPDRDLKLEAGTALANILAVSLSEHSIRVTTRS